MKEFAFKSLAWAGDPDAIGKAGGETINSRLYNKAAISGPQRSLIPRTQKMCLHKFPALLVNIISLYKQLGIAGSRDFLNIKSSRYRTSVPITDFMLNTCLPGYDPCNGRQARSSYYGNPWGELLYNVHCVMLNSLGAQPAGWQVFVGLFFPNPEKSCGPA